MIYRRIRLSPTMLIEQCSHFRNEFWFLRLQFQVQVYVALVTLQKLLKSGHERVTIGGRPTLTNGFGWTFKPDACIE